MLLSTVFNELGLKGPPLRRGSTLLHVKEARMKLTGFRMNAALYQLM